MMDVEARPGPYKALITAIWVNPHRNKPYTGWLIVLAVTQAMNAIPLLFDTSTYESTPARRELFAVNSAVAPWWVWGAWMAASTVACLWAIYSEDFRSWHLAHLLVFVSNCFWYAGIATSAWVINDQALSLGTLSTQLVFLWVVSRMAVTVKPVTIQGGEYSRWSGESSLPVR